MVIFVNANIRTLKNLFISDEIHSNRKEYKIIAVHKLGMHSDIGQLIGIQRQLHVHLRVQFMQCLELTLLTKQMN